MFKSRKRERKYVDVFMSMFVLQMNEIAFFFFVMMSMLLFYITLITKKETLVLYNHILQRKKLSSDWEWDCGWGWGWNWEMGKAKN